MRYLTIAEVLYLHRMVIAQAGGSLSREGLLRWVDAHIRPSARPS